MPGSRRITTLLPARRRRGCTVLGLMAGTSGDGIDAACMRIEGVGPAMRVHFIGHVHQDFDRSLRRRLLAAMAPAQTTTQELARLHADMGEAFGHAAHAALRAMGETRRAQLIGLAGQTICHLPHDRRRNTVTLQLGEPARVARISGLPVVAEFRQSDVAAGGQGAPLVPWTDWVLFRHPQLNRAVQNLGGIGNVTWLPRRAAANDVVAFDTGPGNMVIDGVVERLTAGRERMDRNGKRAARGEVLETVLRRWLRHPYFRRRPPKTTGREMFGRAFVDAEWPRLTATSPHPDDWVATATALTARTIAQTYERFLCPSHQPLSVSRGASGKARHPTGSGSVWSTPAFRGGLQIILCGGGVRNPTLCRMIQNGCPGAEVVAIDALGIPAEAKEAVSFAMLAKARIDAAPANLPQVTGAKRPCVLGAIVEP